MKTATCMGVLATLAGTTSAEVIITGILDGTLPGGDPKVIELYIDGTVDFAGYNLLRSSNGNPFGSASDLSGLGIITDSFVYLTTTSDLVDFVAIFGNSGDFANVFEIGNVTGNGDDGFQIANASAVVIDQVWQEDTSDAYLDSYLYRMDGTGPDGATWTPGNWFIPGNNTLDGMNESEIAAAVPFGTYLVPSPGSLALLGLGGLIGTRRRR